MREGEDTADQRAGDGAGDAGDEYEVSELGRRGAETAPRRRSLPRDDGTDGASRSGILVLLPLRRAQGRR